ncbi:hypothetical protein [Halomicrobium salinisoli]|uniref:hypothetical protein n=1 Tax=Halomicrobium salinisoli TaxID=2878391 RepID=UPI001CF0C9CE|nr:hypothetical protein [Halomicrobium salinisoli]
MSEKDTTLTMRLTSNRKEQWSQLADERGFNGLSDLIRFAVTQVENGNVDPSPDSGTSENGSPDVSGIPDDLETRLKRIEGKIDDVNDGVDVVKREATSSASYERKSTTPAREVVMGQLPSGNGPSDGVFPGVIAQNLGADKSAVAEMLQRLASELAVVKTSDEHGPDGETVYWKED